MNDFQEVSIQPSEARIASEVLATGLFPVTGVLTRDPGWWALKFVVEFRGNRMLTAPLLLSDQEGGGLATLLAVMEHELARLGRLDAIRAQADRERVRLRDLEAATPDTEFAPHCEQCDEPARYATDGTLDQSAHKPGCPGYQGRRDG